MHHPEFPVVTILSAVLLLFPLPWHWSAGNVSMLSMIFWLFLSNIIYAVDSIVWAGNVNEVAVLWCDITTKIIIGSNVALPAACLSICIHLEQLASVRQATQTQASKRRRQYFELGLCFGLPAFVMALHYTVQGHRFDIIEDFGCRPATYISWPSILLIWILPIILAVLTLGFAACAFMHFMRRRANFAHHLEGRSSLTTTRYMRLILMSIFEMAWGLAITCFALWFATLSYRPWTNWADVHSDWNRIDLYSIVFMPSFLLRDYIIVWWAVPISTWIFVLFFAFGHDAMEGYRAVGLWFQKHVLRRNVGKAGPTNSFSSKPSVRPPPLSSFGTSMTTLAGTEAKSSPTLPIYPSPAMVNGAPHRQDDDVSLSDYSIHSSDFGSPPAFSESSFSHSPQTPEKRGHDLV